VATDPTQDRREFPTQLSRGNVRVHISTIRVLGTARSATYLYHQKGSIDDDCDDGTESLMS